MSKTSIWCSDGPRKGRVFDWGVSKTEFVIGTILPYPGYPGIGAQANVFYKVYMAWGTGVLIAKWDRTEYQRPWQL